MERFLKLPRYSFTSDAIACSPDDAGVYGLFENGQLIYVGKAINGTDIKTCLLLHRHGAMGTCTQRATSYTWEITIRPRSREVELLSQFLEANGNEPRCQTKAA